MKGSRHPVSIFHVTLSFLFLFIVEGVLADPITHLCRPEQRDALLEFKNEFEIGTPSLDCLDSHPKTESWTNKSDCCNWEGVTCNAKSGVVMKLDLSSSCLHGQFHSNSSLQNLHFLTALNLSYNDFGGQILSSFENLSQLTTIIQTYNHFSSQIPPSIGKLSHLISRDFQIMSFLVKFHLQYGTFLFSPHFTLPEIIWYVIPSSIGNLSHLTSLDFTGNYFVGPITSSIANLSHLTSLSFMKNNFVGHIPSWIGSLSHLTDVYLAENNFFGQIPSSIGNLSQLINLDLSNNQFVGQIPPSFGNLKQLTTLDIGSNKLSRNLPSSLFIIPSLITLCLDNNQISGTLEFGNTSSPSKLQFLNLNDNQFRGPIPSSISKLTNLVDLQLRNNNFKGSIPSSISKLTNLWRLEISDINTQDPTDFSIFSHLNALGVLSLSHLNTTTTIDLNGFLSYFKWLYGLDLSSNRVSLTNKSSGAPSQLIHYAILSGCSINEVPGLLRSQHHMMYIDISNSKIKGQVPHWLWTLPDLVYVDLSNNTFTGFENSTKTGLSSVSKSSIKYLIGSTNNFTGELPSFICALHYLSTLDLSNNNFNGSIPPCMGNLERTLSVLNLRHNHLHGCLPENVFKSLRALDVGHNQLVGKLPRSLIHFSTLEILNVESNNINDTFPFWLTSLQKLQVLVLRYNAFHGPVHKASFPKLQIIDISHNHFTGTLSSNYFVKWSAMSSLGTYEDQWDEKYMGNSYYHDSMGLVNKGVEMELVLILKIYTALDFSGNKFEGEIPRSIGLLKELLVLNLSNNAFTGQRLLCHQS